MKVINQFSSHYEISVIIRSLGFGSPKCLITWHSFGALVQWFFRIATIHLTMPKVVVAITPSRMIHKFATARIKAF